MWAIHSCERVSTFGFGGGIHLIPAPSPEEIDIGGGRGGGVGGGGGRGGGGGGGGMQARYNYYSIHKDTSDHVLWPWHEWHKVLVSTFFCLTDKVLQYFFFSRNFFFSRYL